MLRAKAATAAQGAHYRVWGVTKRSAVARSTSNYTAAVPTTLRVPRTLIFPMNWWGNQMGKKNTAWLESRIKRCLRATSKYREWYHLHINESKNILMNKVQSGPTEWLGCFKTMKSDLLLGLHHRLLRTNPGTKLRGMFHVFRPQSIKFDEKQANTVVTKPVTQTFFSPLNKHQKTLMYRKANNRKSN